MAESQTEASQYQQAQDGKTELSLMHFTVSYSTYVSFFIIALVLTMSATVGVLIVK